MQTACTFETSGTTYRATQRHIPKDLDGMTVKASKLGYSIGMSDTNTKPAVIPHTVRDDGRVQVETCRKGRCKQVTNLWLTKVSY
jgi:hypothetical protein